MVLQEAIGGVDWLNIRIYEVGNVYEEVARAKARFRFRSSLSSSKATATHLEIGCGTRNLQHTTTHART